MSVEEFKFKRMLATLDCAKGDGTSVLSVLIPPGYPLAKVSQLLTGEMGAAANIKSRVNRQSVLTALKSAKSQLKLYNRVPTNGLCLYCGLVRDEDDKEKKMKISFEPPRPIASFTYLCEDHFYTKPLGDLINTAPVYGFIVIDGHGATFASVQGSSKTVLQKLAVDLPRKHNKGGQSSAYVRKICEQAAWHFLNQDNRATIAGLVLAGSADLKNEVHAADVFSPKLREIVRLIADTSEGGESGLAQAIAASVSVFVELSYGREQELLTTLLTRISTDGLAAVTLKPCMAALDVGAVDTLIIWSGCPALRVVLRDRLTDAQQVLHYRGKAEMTADPQLKAPNVEIVSREPLIDWLVDHHTDKGARLEIVSDSCPQAVQFVAGLGGIGALLRYAVAYDEDGFEPQGGDAQDEGWDEDEFYM